MSISPFSIPTILAPKIRGTWRLCMDSRVIKKIATRYRFPIPMVKDLMDYISKAMYYSNTYLKIVYH